MLATVVGNANIKALEQQNVILMLAAKQEKISVKIRGCSNMAHHLIDQKFPVMSMQRRQDQQTGSYMEKRKNEHNLNFLRRTAGMLE